MEDKALDTLRIMLGRRKLETNTERLTSDTKKMEKMTLYTIGDVLVCFSQKEIFMFGKMLSTLTREKAWKLVRSLSSWVLVLF